MHRGDELGLHDKGGEPWSQMHELFGGYMCRQDRRAVVLACGLVEERRQSGFRWKHAICAHERQGLFLAGIAKWRLEHEYIRGGTRLLDRLGMPVDIGRQKMN